MNKLTPPVLRKLLTAIRAGNYISVAARHAGIHPNTLSRWIKRGREGKGGAYRKLYEEVAIARGDPEIRAVRAWQKHMTRSWHAAAAYLERRYPERWAKRTNQRGGTTRRPPRQVPFPADEAFAQDIARTLDEIGAHGAGDSSTSMDDGHPAQADGETGGVSGSE